VPLYAARLEHLTWHPTVTARCARGHVAEVAVEALWKRLPIMTSITTAGTYITNSAKLFGADRKDLGAGPATDVGERLVMRIGLIVSPGFAVLSFAPLSVFEAANGVLGKPFYEVHAVSVTGGHIPNSFGMKQETERVTDGAFDTLLIGSPPELRAQSPELLSFLRSAPATTRRIASICIGAFILGDAGLLDGRRATTHWLYANELQRRYPKAIVEMDRIFIADGQIWTSAGMTAGIDLALGLIERDIGREKTRELARMLVVHHRRAGGQSQHSALLDFDAASDRVQMALQFARSNLGMPLTVEKLA